MAQASEAVWPVEDLADLVGDARLVLLGESTHGTHEFYAVRAALTRRLIAEHGFRAVAVEGAWPAAARVHRYVRRIGDDRSADQALADFVRFPRWMWRNQVIVELVHWLRDHGHGTGFYGLDLCLPRARGQVVVELGGGGARLAAEQDARLAAAEDRYQRAVDQPGPQAWNLRDTHMADTLDSLYRHLEGARIVVWAHNSHVGDARATEMGRLQGEVSLGQLARQRHGDAACLVGFTTHAGSVTAARDWGGPAEARILAASLENSLERLLHEAGVTCGVLDLRRGVLADQELVERMIGVVYRPETELWNHYMNAHPVAQFDLLVHIDRTSALDPLDPLDRPSTIGEPAETLLCGL